MQSTDSRNFKKVKKVYYIDSFCHGSMHENFNACLLQMCAWSFQEVVWLSERLNRDAVSKLIAKNELINVSWRSLYVVQGNGKIKLLLRYFISALQNIRLLIFCSSNSILVFNYNNVFSIHLVNLLNKLYRKRVLIFCHGEMELLDKDIQTGGGLHKMLAYFAQAFFLNEKIRIQKDIYLSVMGERIKENLKSYLSEQKSKQLISIDHPYIFTDSINKHFKKKASELSIGTIGVFNKIKGGDNIILLAHALAKETLPIRLSITGRIFYDADILRQNNINLPSKAGALLSRAEFTDRLEKLDYILFLYPSNTYRMVASGAIFDAINMKKPIIALRNDFFAYLFEKFGPFGYLVDSIDEMVVLLKKLIENINHDSCFNFETIQERLTSKAVSKNFSTSIAEIGYL